MKQLTALLSVLITSALVVALNQKLGGVPPLGKFLSPFVGFWQNAEAASDADPPTEWKTAGLRAPVTIRYDNDRVPHVFADNDHDAYFAQGYVTARDRLWQMEFHTHAAAGRLSEIVGAAALPFDRYKRRMGTVAAAEASLRAIQADSTTRQVVEAYTAGVNAYLAQLAPRDYPLEYKLLDYAPEPWTPLKIALFSKEMTHTLAGGSDDFKMTNALARYGPAVVNDLFPDYPVRESPVVPSGTPLDFTPLPVPAPPPGFLAQTSPHGEKVPRPEGIGSNNWAVSGQKSASGYPILANDPHLTLSLPSIWYQVQLHAPGLNVCGASLPGVPGVIIGFNAAVAWGVTNVDADVMDWYQIKFKDASRRQYWHDGKWKPTTTRLETIKLRGKSAVVDTVVYTHHGPVVYAGGEKPFNASVPVGHAMRWIAFEESNDVKTFYQLNRAKNYADYLTAMAAYTAPAQNFIFADNEKDIAIMPNGKFPLKWREQGKFVLDGTDPAHDWRGWIPAAHNPRAKNPARGYVSSANQHSTDTLYPYYLNWRFAPAERALRINQRLEAMTGATPDSLRALQNDVYNLNAALLLPTLLALVPAQSLTAEQRTALAELQRWRYQNTGESIGATLFEAWRDNLGAAIWADDFTGPDNAPLRYPSRDRTVEMILRQPNAPWYDDVRTADRRETLADLAAQTFRAMADTLRKRHGPLGPAWQWGNVKSTDVLHLTREPALSRMNVFSGGGGSMVNATTERTGPSWRMVVALGQSVRAYGLYPGGQSGNPGSPYYDNMLEGWRTGQLNELVFLTSREEQNARVTRIVRLSK